MDEYMFNYTVSKSEYVPEATTCLEIFSYSDSTFNSVVEIPLTTDEFENFLYQNGTFRPHELPKGVVQVAAVRLILQQNARQPEAFTPGMISFKPAAYVSMVKAFRLPYKAIEGSSAVGPFFWAAFTHDTNNPHLQIAYRKSDVRKKGLTRGWELTMSHNLNSGVTTGFCKGTPNTDLVECVKHLKASVLEIGHPLVFPMIIFSHDMARNTDSKQRETRDWLRRIEHAVTLRGNLDADTNTGYTDKNGLVDFELINRQLAECHSQVLWKKPQAYIEILDGIAKVMQNFIEALPATTRDTVPLLMAHRDITSRMEFYRKKLQSLDHYKHTTLQRIEIQRSALSIACSQLENRVNFQIATSQRKLAQASKRDAVAQKTLALLGAVFLPGAYLASVFSTTFFNWQSGQDPTTVSYVSPFFWIYWAITVPLTLLIVGSFWMWDRRRARKHDEEDQQIELEMNSIKFDAQHEMRHKTQESMPRTDMKMEGDGLALQRWDSG